MDIKERVRCGLPLTGFPVIDCHGHFGTYITAPSLAECVTEMDSLGIDRACISVVSAVIVDPREENRKLVDILSRYPQRFIGLAVADPWTETKEGLRIAFDEYGARGIKIHPACTGTHIHDAGYRAMWEFARERKAFVLSHTWHGTNHSPKLFVTIAEEYPDVTIILGHSGGVYEGYREAMEAARSHANIYMDISSAEYSCLWPEQVVARVGAHKLLFGTDMPYLDPKFSLGRVAYADISEDQKKMVLGGTMLKILEKT